MTENGSCVHTFGQTARATREHEIGKRVFMSWCDGYARHILHPYGIYQILEALSASVVALQNEYSVCRQTDLLRGDESILKQRGFNEDTR